MKLPKLFKSRDKPTTNALSNAYAFLMALDRAIRNMDEGGSVYDKRGILVL